MWFEVGNKIYVHEPTQELVNYCKSELVLNNPEYTKKLTMGLWLGNTPQNFALYEKVGNDLVLPFGCIFDMYRRYCREYPFTITMRTLCEVREKGLASPNENEKAELPIRSFLSVPLCACSVHPPCILRDTYEDVGFMLAYP